MKQEYTNLLRPIVKEIRKLESTGIDIEEDINLEGTLVGVSCDNLGGNETFGFVESFSACFYCRSCRTPKNECAMLTRENPATLSWKQAISILWSRKAYTNTVYSNHILEKKSVDVMHDLNEGLMPITLELVLKYCCENNILNKNDLVAK